MGTTGLKGQEICFAKCLKMIISSFLKLKRAMEELNEVIAEKEELKQRCQELDLQVTTFFQVPFGENVID